MLAGLEAMMNGRCCFRSEILTAPARSSAKSISLDRLMVMVLVHFTVWFWSRPRLHLRSVCAAVNRSSPHFYDWHGVRWTLLGARPVRAPVVCNFQHAISLARIRSGNSEPAHWKRMLMTWGKRNDHAATSAVGRIRFRCADAPDYTYHSRSRAPFGPRARLQYRSWGSRHQHWCASPQQAGSRLLTLLSTASCSICTGRTYMPWAYQPPHGVISAQQRQWAGCLKCT